MPRVRVISDTHGLLRPEAIVFLRGSDFIVDAGDIGTAGVLHPDLIATANTGCYAFYVKLQSLLFLAFMLFEAQGPTSPARATALMDTELRTGAHKNRLGVCYCLFNVASPLPRYRVLAQLPVC